MSASTGRQCPGVPSSLLLPAAACCHRHWEPPAPPGATTLSMDGWMQVAREERVLSMERAGAQAPPGNGPCSGLLPGRAGCVAGSVWICRVLGVGVQHPSAVRRHSGLAEVPGGVRHPQGAPRHWARGTQTTSVAPAQPCQGGANTLVLARPAGVGLGTERGAAVPAPSLSA